MPEGPEVRRQAVALDDALSGRPVIELAARTKAARPWLDLHAETLPGRVVERVRSHGKHLIGRIEGDAYFHSHLMMWGRWTVHQPDAEAVVMPERRERARIVVPDAVAILTSAPVYVMGSGDPYADDERLAGLGPDILPYPDDGPFGADAFLERLTAPEQHDRTIGAALLDQRIAAGIGTYLRAEILFVCRIDPWRTVAALRPDERAALVEAIPGLARRSYLHHRTIEAADQARMREDETLVYSPGQEWGMRHYAFRRTNLPCLRCDDVIRQLHQVTHTSAEGEEKKRIIYFCPTCQGTTVAVKPPKPRPASPRSA